MAVASCSPLGRSPVANRKSRNHGGIGGGAAVRGIGTAAPGRIDQRFAAAAPAEGSDDGRSVSCNLGSPSRGAADPPARRADARADAAARCHRRCRHGARAGRGGDHECRLAAAKATSTSPPRTPDRLGGTPELPLLPGTDAQTAGIRCQGCATRIASHFTQAQAASRQHRREARETPSPRCHDHQLRTGGTCAIRGCVETERLSAMRRSGPTASELE